MTRCHEVVEDLAKLLLVGKYAFIELDSVLGLSDLFQVPVAPPARVERRAQRLL